MPLPLDLEAEAYRQAAEDTLGQLRWVVGYLQAQKKTKLAAQLAQNADDIEAQIR